MSHKSPEQNSNSGDYGLTDTHKKSGISLETLRRIKKETQIVGDL